MFLNQIASLEHKVLSMGIDISNANHPLTSRLKAARERYVVGDKALGCANACYVQFLLEDLEKIRKASYE